MAEEFNHQESLREQLAQTAGWAEISGRVKPLKFDSIREICWCYSKDSEIQSNWRVGLNQVSISNWLIPVWQKSATSPKQKKRRKHGQSWEVNMMWCFSKWEGARGEAAGSNLGACVRDILLCSTSLYFQENGPRRSTVAYYLLINLWFLLW